MLSKPASAVWAKSVRDEWNVVTAWLPLYQHLDDTRGVTRRLVDEWLPRQVVDRIAADLPSGREGVRDVAGWLAAVHDVGKASPAFAVQVPLLCERIGRAGLHTDPLAGAHPARRTVRHELVGYLAVRDWLMDAQAIGGLRAKTLAVVVGSHHGVPPEDSQLQNTADSPNLAGVGRWGGPRRAACPRHRSVRRGASARGGAFVSVDAAVAGAVDRNRDCCRLDRIF